MKAYLQGPDGQEIELTVTEPDPADGSYCLQMPTLANQLPWLNAAWVRIVPEEDLILPGETAILYLSDLA